MNPRSYSSGVLSHGVGRVNVTPLIDVVMCLIVFYLIVGHLVMVKRSEEHLPRTQHGIELDTPTEPVVVTVRDASTVLIDGEDERVARLESRLAGRLAREPGLRVEIRASREIGYGQVRPTIEACRAAGVGSVELATERAP